MFTTHTTHTHTGLLQYHTFAMAAVFISPPMSSSLSLSLSLSPSLSLSLFQLFNSGYHQTYACFMLLIQLTSCLFGHFSHCYSCWFCPFSLHSSFSDFFSCVSKCAIYFSQLSCSWLLCLVLTTHSTRTCRHIHTHSHTHMHAHAHTLTCTRIHTHRATHTSMHNILLFERPLPVGIFSFSLHPHSLNHSLTHPPT